MVVKVIRFSRNEPVQYNDPRAIALSGVRQDRTVMLVDMAFLYGHNVSRIRIIIHDLEVAYSIEYEYRDNTELPTQHASAPSR